MTAAEIEELGIIIDSHIVDAMTDPVGSRAYDIHSVGMVIRSLKAALDDLAPDFTPIDTFSTPGFDAIRRHAMAPLN